MNTFVYFATGPLVYVAVAVFVLGTISRIAGWLRTSRSPMALGTFPKPAGVARPARVLVDTVLFPQVAEVNRGLWVVAILFHLALAGVFVGHLHLIGSFPGGLETVMSSTAAVMGSVMGLVWLFGAFWFLIRRFKSPVKELSVPEDYLLLLLLIGVIGMGDHLRLFAHVNVSVYQEYLRNLLTFRPALPAALAASPYKTSFVVHILLANLFLIYFPFSKLMHFVGAFFTNSLRRS